MKKVLSLVLVIAMVLSSMSFAFASTFEDVTGDYEKAIEALVALDVINGYEDGTFRPENTLKRAELAKLLVEALGYGELVIGAQASFTDTDNHWAEGHIAVAAGTGLVNGYPDGSFKPEQTLTYDEVFAMVIRALGYTEASLKGTWPTNYKVKAIDLGLDDDVVLGKGADRGGVAQVLYNALDEDIVEFDNDGLMTRTGKTLIDNIATLNKNFLVTPETIDPEEKAYAGDKVDLAPYMYQSLKAYLNDDKEVVYIKESNNLVLEGVLNAAGDLTASTIIVEDAKEVDYTFNTTGASFMVNGEETRWQDAQYTNSNVKVKVVLDADDEARLVSNRYDVLGVVAEKQNIARQIDNEYVTGKTKIDGINLPVDSKDKVELDKVVVTGAVDSLEDIAEDDIVVVYEGRNAAGTLVRTKIVVSNDTVEGKITRFNASSSGNNIYIDGVKYTVSNVGGNAQTLTASNVGDEGIFFLDHTGKIVENDEIATASNYAVVISKADGKVASRFGTSIEDYEQVKLATAEGEIVIYDVYVKINSDGDVTGTAKFNAGNIYSGTKSAGTMTSSAITGLANGQLVKYGVNKDGKINKIETTDIISSGSRLAFDDEKANFVFTDNAVVFDGRDTTEFNAVNPSRLKSNGTATHIAYNKDGKIEAMVTVDVKGGETSTYAYVERANTAINSADEDVQLIVAFINGEKVEYLTDDDYSTKVATVGTVYKVELDGEVITSIDRYNTLSGTDLITKTTTTVSSISTSTNSIKVVAGSITAGIDRHFLSSDATILEVEGTDETIIDLYDIVGKSVDVYTNTDGEVVYIVYNK